MQTFPFPVAVACWTVPEQHRECDLFAAWHCITTAWEKQRTWVGYHSCDPGSVVCARESHSAPADNPSKSGFTTKQFQIQLFQGVFSSGYQVRAFVSWGLSTFTKEGVFCHSEIGMWLRTSFILGVAFWVFFPCLVAPIQYGGDLSNFLQSPILPCWQLELPWYWCCSNATVSWCLGSKARNLLNSTDLGRHISAKLANSFCRFILAQHVNSKTHGTVSWKINTLCEAPQQCSVKKECRAV